VSGGIRWKGDFGRTMTFVGRREFLVVTFDQLRHRVAGGFGHGARISVDILELGSLEIFCCYIWYQSVLVRNLGLRARVPSVNSSHT
jgi:hypothetical protein